MVYISGLNRILELNRGMYSATMELVVEEEVVDKLVEKLKLEELVVKESKAEELRAEEGGVGVVLLVASAANLMSPLLWVDDGLKIPLSFS